MFTHKIKGVAPHLHEFAADARACEEDYLHPHIYDEDGQIAMMRMLETNEVQRAETDAEEAMAAALFEPRDVYWDGTWVTRSEEQAMRLADAQAASTHNGAITAMFRSRCD